MDTHVVIVYKEMESSYHRGLWDQLVRVCLILTHLGSHCQRPHPLIVPPHLLWH